MSTTISVPGAHGAPPLIFKIAGTSAGNYGKAFQSEVFQQGVVIHDLSTGDKQTSTGSVLNQVFSSSGTGAYTLQFGGQNTFVDTGYSTTVTGSMAGGDTVLATGITTYDAIGQGNIVTFIDGSSVYNGGTTTGDTITGGSGFDTINTGTGSDIVFSGSGHTLINMNDTAGGVAFLGDGAATVNADGFTDDVVSGSNGQLIFGDTVAGGTLNMIIGDNAKSTGPAADTVVANASTTNVFDSVGGNSIFGGSGVLTFVGGAASHGEMADTIVGGTGSTFIYGSSGDNLTFAGDTSGSVATFVAGIGNETLNAANADGRVDFFGASSSASSATFVGSTTGYNYFQTGGNASTTPGSAVGGAESLVGGTGTNIFGIADGGANSHITVFDFAAGNDSVNFLGQTAAQVTADLNAASVGSVNGTPDLTVTLSDNTTVTFVGISSLSGHVVGQNNT